jgi:hypothetical protein
MTKDDLIDYIINDLTASGALPFQPPRQEISRIIDIESKFLYREYRDGSEAGWYILNHNYFNTIEWKTTKTFQLPDCVISVSLVHEIKGGMANIGINDPDMSFDRLMAADLFLQPISTDQLMYRTIQMAGYDQSKQFILRDINHNFNINTHRLQITGRTPQHSLYVTTLNKIPDEEFYEDTLVISWMIAKSKIALSKMLGAFTYNLIGGVTINAAQWKEEANAELTELKAKIISDNAPDWFIFFA